jgi:hypothetical protein
MKYLAPARRTVRPFHDLQEPLGPLDDIAARGGDGGGAQRHERCPYRNISRISNGRLCASARGSPRQTTGDSCFEENGLGRPDICRQERRVAQRERGSVLFGCQGIAAPAL